MMNLRKTALALCFSLGAVMTVQPAQAVDLANMTAEEQAAFGANVRAYLLANPQVLVEVINVLEGQQAEAKAQTDQDLVKTYADAIFNDGYSYVGGNPDGDITVVEFMDYKCGYCKKAYPEVEALLKADGNIRFIVKEFPILGEQSVLGAQFAMAVIYVGGFDVYKSAHDQLMGLRGDITTKALKKIADDLGLDWAEVEAEMKGEVVNANLAQTQELARAMSISGTPTFVMGSELLRGYVPLDGMLQIVAAERAKK